MQKFTPIWNAGFYDMISFDHVFLHSVRTFLYCTYFSWSGLVCVFWKHSEWQVSGLICFASLWIMYGGQTMQCNQFFMWRRRNWKRCVDWLEKSAVTLSARWTTEGSIRLLWFMSKNVSINKHTQTNLHMKWRCALLRLIVPATSYTFPQRSSGACCKNTLHTFFFHTSHSCMSAHLFSVPVSGFFNTLRDMVGMW